MWPARYYAPRYFPSRYWERHPAGPPPVAPPPTLTIPAGHSSATFRYRNHTPGVYTLTALPGAGPLAGKGACSSAEAIIVPSGLTLNNLLAVNQPGLPPTLYLSRTDVANVAVFDILTPGVSVANMVYETHPISSPEFDGTRNARQKCTIVRVYGSGMITAGTMTVIPDLQASRGETVDATKCGPPSSKPEKNEECLLYFEPDQQMVGRCFHLLLNLTGTNIVIKDWQAELVPMG